MEQGDKRRIISPIDDEELVMTIGREGEVVLDEYDEILESKKIFIYTEDGIEKSVEVPNGYKILGETEVTYFE